MYVVHRDPNWDYMTLDFDKDVEPGDKSEGGMMAATNPANSVSGCFSMQPPPRRRLRSGQFIMDTHTHFLRDNAENGS